MKALDIGKVLLSLFLVVILVLSNACNSLEVNSVVFDDVTKRVGAYRAFYKWSEVFNAYSLNVKLFEENQPEGRLGFGSFAIVTPTKELQTNSVVTSSFSISSDFSEKGGGFALSGKDVLKFETLTGSLDGEFVVAFSLETEDKKGRPLKARISLTGKASEE